MTANIKHYTVSILDFKFFVAKVMADYSVAVDSDYEQTLKKVVVLTVEALLGESEYKSSFNKLVTFLENTLSASSYMQAVQVAEILISNLSNIIFSYTDAHDPQINTQIQSGKLFGHWVLLSSNKDVNIWTQRC